MDRVLDRRHRQPSDGYRADIISHVRPPAGHSRDKGRKKGHSNKKSVFKRIFSDTEQDLRWSGFKRVTPAEEMLKLVRDKVFPHFKTIMMDSAKFGEYMKDAQLMIQKPSLLVSAVNMIDKLPLRGEIWGRSSKYQFT